MPTESSKDFASEYFANLNPIASKISLDINETKSSYEHIWNQLTPVEQIDIINETLIKPEIALKYFDNLSTSSSSGLLTTNDDNDYLPADGEFKKHFCDKLLSTKNIYSYDFKNLLTYSIQKTGLKLIHDDAIGAFRDEHSMPFSYKTKSQINLRIFSDCNLNHKSDMLQSQDAVPFNLGKYHSNKADNITTNNSNKTKLSSQITQSTLQNNDQNDQNTFDKIDGKYERFYNENILKEDINNMHQNKLFSNNDTEIDDSKSNFLSKFICKNNLIFNAGTNLLVKNRQNDEDEIMNLMKNVSYGGLTSSSSVPSEEEEDKQMCEDSKLLLENDELRKGFDFLNNW